MLANIHCLLDEAVDVLGDLRGATCLKRFIPFFLSRRTIFCPVRSFRLGTASLSLIATPTWEGESPFLAIVTIKSVIDLGVWATHLAVLRLKGVTAELIPFPLPFDWILPIHKLILIK
jgi:hypothetical protein